MNSERLNTCPSQRVNTMCGQYVSNVNGQRHEKKAFALIELMIVIALMIILTAISFPAVASLTKSGRINQTVTEVGGLLEQARQYAVAQNTYVWVTFHTQTKDNVDKMYVTVVASKDGTDPGIYGTVPSTTFELISKVRTFQHVQLKEAGTFTPSEVTSLPSSPTVGSANALSLGTPFKIAIPGQTGSATFAQSIQFTPTGEARNAVGPIDVIEFALEPAQTSRASDPNNVAVVRLNGITGQALVYRK